MAELPAAPALPAGTCRARRDRVRAALADADALLVTDPRNVRYLSGFTGSAGSLLLASAPERDRLVTDGRYALQAAEEAPDLPATITRDRTWLTAAVPPGAALALEGAAVSWDEARAITALLADRRVVPAAGLVERERAVKDEVEIALLARACAIAGAAFTATLEHIAAGRTERAVAAHLERAMVELGADARAFPSIVASGPNGARPHHRPTSRVLQRGDVITMDFGALVAGYHSDMTRLVCLGPPEGRLADVVEAVGRAQRAGVAAVRAGVATGAVDAVCRDTLDADGLGEAFVHGTGHGVGLALHERPSIARDGAATLRNRMVVTVEPGAYLPDLGGARIEDTLVVRPDGADTLTTVPTEPFIL